MKRAWLAPALAACVFAAAAAAAVPLVKREFMAAAENDFKDQLQSREIDVFGVPRGIYVEGIGVIFTADVSLAYAPMANPFQQAFSPEMKQRIYSKKAAQVPVLIDEMKKAVLKTAGSLDGLPMNEQVIVGVTIGYQTWENKSGLPLQIVAQGQKMKLLEAKMGKAPADSAISLQIQQ